jgi:hypothetical protein
VRADQNVNLPQGHSFENFLLFCRGTKPREHFHRDGKFGHSLAERSVMLLCQHCRGYQNSSLATVINGLEDSPHGHFGFAEADVSADQSIHGFASFPCRT